MMIESWLMLVACSSAQLPVAASSLCGRNSTNWSLEGPGPMGWYPVGLLLSSWSAVRGFFSGGSTISGSSFLGFNQTLKSWPWWGHYNSQIIISVSHHWQRCEVARIDPALCFRNRIPGVVQGLFDLLSLHTERLAQQNPAEVDCVDLLGVWRCLMVLICFNLSFNPFQRLVKWDYPPNWRQAASWPAVGPRGVGSEPIWLQGSGNWCFNVALKLENP